MNIKLTLSLNSASIQRAKKYAKRRGVSVSKLVEELFDSLTKSEKGQSQKNPFESLRKLKGIARAADTGNSYQDIIADSIIEKHLK